VPVSLEIIGEGTERRSLENLISKNEAGTYIRLLGQVEKQTLWECVCASDVFVLNTSYEGLSHQLIEVMDIGTPIITTPVGGNSELITHEETGLLIPFNDKEALVRTLRRMYTDRDIRERCVKNAREKAKLFREETIIPEVVALFS
jgi:glycosyltransferase involved in cell wall biosynthesis